MTTSSAAARPYRVFVAVPAYSGGLVTVKTETAYVDRALEPGEIDRYEEGGSRAKTVAACLANSLMLYMVPMGFVAMGLVDGLIQHDAAMIAWAIGGVVAGIGAYIVADRYIDKRQKHFDKVSNDLKGRFVLAPRDGRRQDLRRIQQALTSLQGDYGTQYDDQAREAVAAVLDQDKSRPAEKHLIIADSKADDTDSVAIRARTLAAKATWSGDVAKAEHLVLVLEDAAAGKVPAA